MRYVDRTKSYKTAIGRRTPSAPTKYLEKQGLLVGRMLDFGCGRSTDMLHYNMDGYDLHYRPETPAGKYDTIICHYVLNTVLPEDANLILEDLNQLLNVGGSCYIAVRRDLTKEGWTTKGTYQWNVVLDLPVLYEKKNGYCIYVLTVNCPECGETDDIQDDFNNIICNKCNRKF